MPFISSCISLLGGDFAAVRHAQRRAHGAERREAASNRRLLRQRAHPPPPRCPCLPLGASIKLLSREGGSRRAGKCRGWANRSARRGEAWQLGQWECGEGREGGQ